MRIAKDGSEHKYPAVMVCDLDEGDRLQARDQGGGGYGPPLEREPERVLGDVAERYVSAEIARSVYGVVIKGSTEDDSLEVDWPATEAARAEMGASAN